LYDPSFRRTVDGVSFPTLIETAYFGECEHRFRASSGIGVHDGPKFARDRHLEHFLEIIADQPPVDVIAEQRVDIFISRLLIRAVKLQMFPVLDSRRITIRTGFDLTRLYYDRNIMLVI